MGRVTTWGPALVVLAILAGCSGAGAPDGSDDAVAAVDKAGGSGGTIVLTMGTEGRPGRVRCRSGLPLRRAGRGALRGTDPDRARLVGSGRRERRRPGRLPGVGPGRRPRGHRRRTRPRTRPGPCLGHRGRDHAAGLDRPAAAHLGGTHRRGGDERPRRTSCSPAWKTPESSGSGCRPRVCVASSPSVTRPSSATPWAGGIVRAPRSATTYAFLEALGGEPDDLAGGGGTDRFAEGVRDGTVRAAEGSFRRQYAA
jgi:hypothetical protein